jgi:hypothetical protein
LRMCRRPAVLVSGPRMPGVTASLHVRPSDRARNGHGMRGQGDLAFMRVEHLGVKSARERRKAPAAVSTRSCDAGPSPTPS